MSLFKDRVSQTTNTTGTGTVDLLNPPNGYQSFAVFGNGNQATYVIAHATLNEWEVGIGTVNTTGPTLARTTVLASSNADALVNFSQGNKIVSNVLPADFAATVSVFRNGSGVPDDADGHDGDYYVDTDNGDLYVRDAGTYSVAMNIKGPAGSTGSTGATGAATVWRDGTSGPSNGTGVDGDYFLRTDTGDVYKRASGTYSVVGNLVVGTAGLDGSTWRNGIGAPSNGTGVDGDYYFDGSNGNVYLRTSGVYAVTANIRGADGVPGTPGTNGTNGLTWRYGAGAPSNGTGVDGDLYLRTSNGDVYARASGTYSVVASLTVGTPGTNGTVWRSGSGTPSNGTGVDGDLYFKTSTGDIYLRASGTYSIIANITGPVATGLVISGGFAMTLTGTAITNVTLPTTGTLSTLAGTETLTNKRVKPRVSTMADATSCTPNSDNGTTASQTNTQSTGTLTMNAPTGTPDDAQLLCIRIKSTNVQTFSWNAAYRASGDLVLPTASTGSGKWDYALFIYNAADSKWDILDSNFGH